MRISDWSADVCSSDLIGAENRRGPARRCDPGVAWGTGERDQPVLGKRLDLGPERGEMDAAIDRERGDAAGPRLLREQRPSPLEGELRETAARKIGRASCRGRVCQYV